MSDAPDDLARTLAEHPPLHMPTRDAYGRTDVETRLVCICDEGDDRPYPEHLASVVSRRDADLQAKVIDAAREVAEQYKSGIGDSFVSDLYDELARDEDGRPYLCNHPVTRSAISASPDRCLNHVAVKGAKCWRHATRSRLPADTRAPADTHEEHADG